jgi:hypothetical protein
VKSAVPSGRIIAMAAAIGQRPRPLDSVAAQATSQKHVPWQRESRFAAVDGAAIVGASDASPLCSMNGICSLMIVTVLRRLGLASTLLLLLASPAPVAGQGFGQRCAELPAAVSTKRDAIRAAAAKGDLDALAALADPDDSFGFGDVEDIGKTWTGWKQQGTDMAALATALLALDCSVYRSEDGAYYSWPAAVDLPVNDLSEAEKDKIAEINGGDFASAYLEDPETGYYVGWRIVITEDGRWIGFVAGD